MRGDSGKIFFTSNLKSSMWIAHDARILTAGGLTRFQLDILPSLPSFPPALPRPAHPSSPYYMTWSDGNLFVIHPFLCSQANARWT